MTHDDGSAPVKTHKDYYYILGISPDASERQVQAAFDGLCDKFGPHVSSDSMDADVQARTYRDITAAYEVLMNPVKRKEYDGYHKDLQKTSDVRALWGMVTKKKGSQENSSLLPQFEDNSKVQAVPHNVELEVSLKEAVKGTQKQITITDPTPCQRCLDKKPLERMQCDGCRGLGYFNQDRLVVLDLPPGLYHGLEIRQARKGKYDLKAGKHGDLVVSIKLRKHPVLQVSDRDIRCVVPVSICEAVLGAEIQVPTASGKVAMKIQPLTHQGRTYRLKGLGLAGGDMLVVIEVVVPKQLSGEEVKLFKQLQRVSGRANPREALYRAIDQYS